jgi:hypothetical protein
MDMTLKAIEKTSGNMSNISSKSLPINGYLECKWIKFSLKRVRMTESKNKTKHVNMV